MTVAIYIATRAAEFAYNALDDEGWFKGKPWWWGSWMLMPLATGQLWHAFVFDRECFPKVRSKSEDWMSFTKDIQQAYGDFILKNVPTYIQRRPADYPTDLLWPSTTEIVDSLAKISELKWLYVGPLPIPNA